MRYTSSRTLDRPGQSSARQFANEMQRLLLGLKPDLRARHAKPGETIAREGDNTNFFMLVLEGWVALSKSLDDGETQIIDFLIDGDFALISSKGVAALSFSVEALGDVRYLVFTEDMINGPEPEAATLRSHLAATVTATQSRTAELLLRVGHASAETRVAYALIELYLRLDVIGRVDGSRFHVPMTQKQLGQFTGLSNVHVCRTLRRLARQGLVKTGDHMRIEICDVHAICRMADLDLEDLRAEIIPMRPERSA